MDVTREQIDDIHYASHFGELCTAYKQIRMR